MVNDMQAAYYRYWGKAQKDNPSNNDSAKYHLDCVNDGPYTLAYRTLIYSRGMMFISMAFDSPRSMKVMVR